MSATNNTTTSRGTLGKVFAGAVGAAVARVMIFWTASLRLAQAHERAGG